MCSGASTPDSFDWYYKTYSTNLKTSPSIRYSVFDGWVYLWAGMDLNHRGLLADEFTARLLQPARTPALTLDDRIIMSEYSYEGKDSNFYSTNSPVVGMFFCWRRDGFLWDKNHDDHY